MIMHQDIRVAHRIMTVKLYPDQLNQKHLLFRFPKEKKEIAKLSTYEKSEWYAHQFTKPIYPAELTTKEFARFWRWHFYYPLRLKRFFFRIKNLEIFKKYDHITVMKEKTKKHSI